LTDLATIEQAGSMDRTPVALLRQARPDDLTGIREFVCALSPRSRYLRFFAAVAQPSTGLLRALCGAGGADVLLVTDRRGVIIGHGMAADATTADAGAGHRLESSIGLVVADAWQRRGIGAQLLDALAGRAHRRGVTRLVLEVLPDNRVMLGMIRRRWPEASAERTLDAIVFRPPIDRPRRSPMEAGLLVLQPCQARSHAVLTP
jgi:ribosomal protein S18 acetylase RimI-like enzyme